MPAYNFTFYLFRVYIFFPFLLRKLRLFRGEGGYRSGAVRSGAVPDLSRSPASGPVTGFWSGKRSVHRLAVRSPVSGPVTGPVPLV